MPSFVNAVTEGVNISVFTYGTSHAGKSHTLQGRGGDRGIVSLLGDDIFNMLEDRRYNNQI